MARRSRAIVETARPKYRVWRIAIYIRLSKEDMRCLDESESVTNQRQIIEEHMWMTVSQAQPMTSARTSKGCCPILSGGV